MGRDTTTSKPTSIWHRSSDSIGRILDKLPGVRRSDLVPGDRVIVETKNSVYSIWAWNGPRFVVSGGWYDQHGLSPLTTEICGCTFGGSAICCDIIAAPGLFLEFRDIKTTRIQKVTVIKADSQPRCDH